MAVAYFSSPEEFRRWLEEHHATVVELWVGYHKKGTGRPSLSWQESVDEALCFGWIDGLRKSVDGERYKIRFTPRKPTSVWSAVNIRRFEELTAEGRIHPPGQEAFERRKENRSRIYAYEQEGGPSLSEEFEQRFQAKSEAWAFFSAQPAGYRKTASWWVMSAKREETRLRRLEQLIADSAAGRRIAQLVSKKA